MNTEQMKPPIGRVSGIGMEQVRERIFFLAIWQWWHQAKIYLELIQPAEEEKRKANITQMLTDIDSIKPEVERAKMAFQIYANYPQLVLDKRAGPWTDITDIERYAEIDLLKQYWSLAKEFMKIHKLEQTDKLFLAEFWLEQKRWKQNFSENLELHTASMAQWAEKITYDRRRIFMMGKIYKLIDTQIIRIFEALRLFFPEMIFSTESTLGGELIKVIPSVVDIKVAMAEFDKVIDQDPRTPFNWVFIKHIEICDRAPKELGIGMDMSSVIKEYVEVWFQRFLEITMREEHVNELDEERKNELRSIFKKETETWFYYHERRWTRKIRVLQTLAEQIDFMNEEIDDEEMGQIFEEGR